MDVVNAEQVRMPYTQLHASIMVINDCSPAAATHYLYTKGADS